MLKKVVLKFDIINAIMVVCILVLLAVVASLFNFTQMQKVENINLKNTISRKNSVETSLRSEMETLETKVKDARSASLVQFTAEDLRHDIKIMYPALSKRVKKNIVDTILQESSKYNINPLILYSLLHTESSMRPWIEHKRILINIKHRKKYIRAVGLGGVVWEWWGDALKKEKIAEVRSDLFDAEVNIRAVAYIYNVFYNRKKHKNATTQDESAMIRYFGGGYKSYFERIDKKIAQLIGQKMYRLSNKKTKKGKKCMI
jgi:hypothetical protein